MHNSMAREFKVPNWKHSPGKMCLSRGAKCCIETAQNSHVQGGNSSVVGHNAEGACRPASGPLEHHQSAVSLNKTKKKVAINTAHESSSTACKAMHGKF